MQFVRRERWWWLPVFCLASLVLHLMVGAGLRGFEFGLPARVAAPAPPAEVEVSLSAPNPAGPKTGRGKQAVSVVAAPAAISHPAVIPAPSTAKVVAERRPVRTTVPVRVSPARRAPTETPREAVPATVVGVPPRPITRYTPVISAPASLGIRTGDRTLTPNTTLPVPPRTLAETPKRTLKALGSGGGGGQIAEGVASKDAPASAGSGAAAPGAGTGSGGGVGSGTGTGVGSGSAAAGGGDGAESGVRGLPFGDPNGVRGGGLPNGGGSRNGSAGGGETGGNSGGSSGSGPVRVVYILDCSSSMRDYDKIGRARDALRDALAQLRPGDSFDIIPFGTEAKPLYSGFVPVSFESVGRAVQRVNLLILPSEGTGSTNYSAAFDAATRLPGATHLFFITDGLPSSGFGVPEDPYQPIDYAAIRAYIRRSNRQRSRIYTFAISDGRVWQGIDLLKEIAEDSGGEYRSVDVTRQ